MPYRGPSERQYAGACTSGSTWHFGRHRWQAACALPRGSPGMWLQMIVLIDTYRPCLCSIHKCKGEFIDFVLASVLAFLFKRYLMTVRSTKQWCDISIVRKGPHQTIVQARKVEGRESFARLLIQSIGVLQLISLRATESIMIILHVGSIILH